MRVSPDVLSAPLEGEAVLLDLKTKRYFRLNETAAVIWAALADHIDRGGMIDRLCRDFETDAAQAATAIDALVDQLRGNGMLLEGDDTESARRP